MLTDIFDFNLPNENIALRPASPRHSARLLSAQNGGISDHIVMDLPDLLEPNDLLVFNDTRVIPAQLSGVRYDKNGEGEGAKIGATLHKRIDLRRWQAFIRNAKRLKPNDRIDFGRDVFAIAEERHADGSFTLSFEGEEAVEILLGRAGTMPLPPYIAGKRPTDERDYEDYQTMFAQKDGAVAAPTAALHFTPELMAKLTAANIAHLSLTLHVGAGTFLPVKVDDTDNHVMHSEWGEINQKVAYQMNEARRNGGRIISVGTTSLRLIESATGEDGIIKAFKGDTDIFITPGYSFRGIDGLITNFHLPKSTLFMLVSALMGVDRMQAVYKHAIDSDYRFYSYGDSSILIP